MTNIKIESGQGTVTPITEFFSKVLKISDCYLTNEDEILFLNDITDALLSVMNKYDL